MAIRAGALLATLASPSATAWAQKKPADLTERSLEDLMNIEVTSVSKKDQKTSRTASAIFVITAEDIRRSGALNIPDLLRMVPGVDVAQINANTWAISARGLNSQFSNELLVLVDGRDAYTPTFGGVYWDVLDLPLDDIERIEVIRGPGGSIWGGNAVNGVIDIITKKAAETRGALVVSGGGNTEQGFGTVQCGGSAGKSTDYRIYAKYFDMDHLPGPTGLDGGDGWHGLRGGFRSDSKLSPSDTLSAEGDLFTGRQGDPTLSLASIVAPSVLPAELLVNLASGDFQLDWNHVYSQRSDSTLQISYDTYERDDVLREGRKTFSGDFQNHVAWGTRQDFVWGLGYRYSSSHSRGNLFVALNPANLDTQLFSSFVQDEIAIVPDRLYLTVGAKLEHNYYTGFGVMPSARAMYALSDHHMVWAAVSRALRTPASSDTAVRVNFGGFTPPTGLPVALSLLGNPNSQDERLVAYETGYRATISEHFSFDVAAFYNDYDAQQTTEPAGQFIESTPLPVHLLIPSTYRNFGFGEAHGIEITANWKPTARWTISPGYAFERIHMHATSRSQDTQTGPETEGSDPHVQAQIRSHLDLSRGFSWDASAYFVDRLITQRVPAYTRLDTELSWQWKEGLSVSLVGQNLLRGSHIEFDNPNETSRLTQVKRSAYAQFSWKF